MSHKKEIIKNIFSFGSIDILGLLIPIVTMPILTRGLGPSQYGIYMLLLTIFYFGHTIIDYGTQFTSVRTLAKQRDNPEEIRRIYQDTQGLRLFLWFVYSLGAITYCYFFTSGTVLLYMIFASLTYTLGYALTPLWFYQGIGSVERAMKVSLVIKLFNLIVIIFAINSPDDLNVVFASLCIPMLLGGVYLSYVASRLYHVRPPSLRRLGKSLSDGRDVFIGLLAPNFYNTMPTIALGTIYPPADFVNFAIATRLASVIVTLQNVIAKSVYPIITRLQSDQVIKLMLVNILISVIPLLILFTTGEVALGFILGRNFSEVNDYLLVLAIGIMFIGLNNAISQGYFLPKGYDSVYRNISLRVSFISGMVACMMIYYGGIMGGAIAISVARFLFAADSYVMYRNLRKKNG